MRTLYLSSYKEGSLDCLLSNDPDLLLINLYNLTVGYDNGTRLDIASSDNAVILEEDSDFC